MAAKEPVYSVTDEYGPKLDRVSFKERFLFNKTTNTDWYKSTLEQRKEFLEAYHEDLVAAKLRRDESIKRDVAKEKEQTTIKKTEERTLHQKEMAELQKEMAKQRKFELEKKAAKRKHDKLLKNIEMLRKKENYQKH